MKRTAILAGLVVAFFAPAAAPASADQYVSANPIFPDYLTNEATTAPGEKLFFLNPGLVPHSVTSDATDAFGVPLFDTGLIYVYNQTAVAEAVGADRLPPGDFPFHCRVHGLMHGMLHVR